MKKALKIVGGITVLAAAGFGIYKLVEYIQDKRLGLYDFYDEEDEFEDFDDFYDENDIEDESLFKTPGEDEDEDESETKKTETCEGQEELPTK